MPLKVVLHEQHCKQGLWMMRPNLSVCDVKEFHRLLAGAGCNPVQRWPALWASLQLPRMQALSRQAGGSPGNGGRLKRRPSS